MPRPFDGARYVALVGRAESGFPALANFSEAGDKTPEHYGVSEIDI